MRTLLVIPCLRERARLPQFLPSLMAALKDTQGAGMVDILVVDDGSGQEEQAWLEDYIAGLRTGWPHLLPPLLLTTNAGKGGAVYAGWETASDSYSHAGFVDADGAVPPGETARICASLHSSPHPHPPEAVFAVRTGTHGTTVDRHPARALAGWFFRQLVKVLFRFPIPETQCGCKFVPVAAWQACAAQLTERRFCFDVDLTWHLLDQGTPIRPVPVNWQEIPGGQLRPASVLAMIRSLISLRLKLGPWQSNPRPSSH